MTEPPDRTVVMLAGPEASAALARLESACFDAPWSDESLRALLDDGLTRAWVLCDRSGEGAAGALVRVVAGEGELLRLAVRPDRRRHGLGARLLYEVLAAVAEECPLGVHLEVRASNVVARHLYARAGFLDTGRRGDYYHAPREDAVLMHWAPPGPRHRG